MEGTIQVPMWNKKREKKKLPIKKKKKSGTYSIFLVFGNGELASLMAL